MASQVNTSLPLFRYHPDPLETCSIKHSDAVCVVCGKARGYIYPGPPYGGEEYVEEICPWCIADGSAHRLLAVEFTDPLDIGTSSANWNSVRIPDAVQEEIAYRTPGIRSWQSASWLGHCGDAAAYLGPVGYNELEAFGFEAIEAIRGSTGLEGDEWWDFCLRLDKYGSPTGYIFRCIHCGAYAGYTDCD